MIEIKSKTGKQIIQVMKTSAGVKIKAVEHNTGRSFTVHIFEECIPELIRALILERPKEGEGKT